MTVTIDDFVAKIRELAAEKPNKVAHCEYLKHEPYNPEGDEFHLVLPIQPVCIVGTAVIDLFGADDEVVNQLDALEGTSSRIVLEHFGLDGGHIVSDQRKVDWIDWVQNSQDSGNKWDYAVSKADNEYPIS